MRLLDIYLPSPKSITEVCVCCKIKEGWWYLKLEFLLLLIWKISNQAKSFRCKFWGWNYDEILVKFWMYWRIWCILDKPISAESVTLIRFKSFSLFKIKGVWCLSIKMSTEYGTDYLIKSLRITSKDFIIISKILWLLKVFFFNYVSSLFGIT